MESQYKAILSNDLQNGILIYYANSIQSSGKFCPCKADGMTQKLNNISNKWLI